MDIAVIGTSKKENEKRVAIHPQHIKEIPGYIREHLFFEKGYGVPFGMDDNKIEELTGNSNVDRETLLQDFDAIIIPKPVEEDFEEISNGASVWGWIHSVQTSSIVDIAVKKNLTLTAWENMYHKGSRDRTHIFQKNNEMAGYCGVQHALQLKGIDGTYGLERKAVILSMGSVSRGAIYALKGHGFSDITVFTQRPAELVTNQIPGIRYRQISKGRNGRFLIKNSGGSFSELINELIKADIIVNGVLQNPNSPATFIRDDEIVKFKKDCLIVDISCDAGMGFSFARPTSFAEPLYKVGRIFYYSIDHTPSLLWNSASWEISKALLPYLEDFMEQRENPVLDDAVDIKNGIILNKKILSYQNRSHIYPYEQINGDPQEAIES